MLQKGVFMEKINYISLEKNFKNITNEFIDSCKGRVELAEIKGDKDLKIKEQIKSEVMLAAQKMLQAAYLKTQQEELV